MRGDNNSHVWVTMQFSNQQLASVPGDNDGHPFDLNDPHEDEEQNLHAGDYSIQSSSHVCNNNCPYQKVS